MISFQVRIDKKVSKVLEGMRGQMPQVLDNSVSETATFGKGLIIRSSPPGKGGTSVRNNWTSNKVSEFTYRIWNRLKHAAFLETGTGIFGPRHRRIYAAEVTKTGGPFHWLIYGARNAVGRSIKRNTVMGEVFAMSTMGMPAQPMIEPNTEKIQKDLNNRIRRSIRHMWENLKKRQSGGV